MEDRGARHKFLDPDLESFEVFIGGRLGTLDGLFADGVAVDVGAELADAI